MGSHGGRGAKYTSALPPNNFFEEKSELEKKGY
jgi:hypothetical protein